MTILSNVLSDLSTGVLSNLRLGNSGGGFIDEAHLPKVLLFLNDGLTKLYTKFALKRSMITVSIPIGETVVSLASAPDFIKVIGVEIQDNLGIYHKVPLNDAESIVTSLVPVLYPDINNYTYPSVFTPTYNVLEVPVNTTAAVTYKVHYQAKHPTFAVGDLGSKDVELPETLYEALLSYIAHKAYSGLNTVEAVAAATRHFAQYNLICDGVTVMDTVSQSVSNTNTRFHNNGWR